MADIETTIKNDWAWVTHHVITLVLAGFFALGGIYLIESLVAKHDAIRASETSAALDSQAAQTQNLQQQILTFERDAEQRDAAYQKTISQLTQTIATRDANAQKQQATDATLDANASAQRLALQTNANPSEITANGDAVTLDLPVTRRVVSSLDLLVATQADLKDTQSQLTAQKGLTVDAVGDADGQKKIVASQTVQLGDAKKACDAQVASLKATNRKRNIKYFLFGGAVVEAVKIYFTHSL